MGNATNLRENYPGRQVGTAEEHRNGVPQGSAKRELRIRLWPIFVRADSGDHVKNESGDEVSDNDENP